MKNFPRFKIIVSLFVLLFIIIFFTNCNDASNESAPVAVNISTDLNSIITELPDAPGHEAFQQNCVSCHSARYVQIQPDLTEKTWTAIVTKMQKSFGAPVADSSGRQIVQYLVAIKGRK